MLDVSHPMAGLTFPARVGPWLRGEPTRGGEFGHELMVGYGGLEFIAGVQATVYVHPAIRPAAEEMSDAIDAIMRGHANVTAKAHGLQTIRGVEGSWAVFELDNAHAATPARVCSWVWVSGSDGWVVKYRCTNWSGAATDTVEKELRNLATTIGIPETTIRISRRRKEALKRSTAAISALESWQPVVEPQTEAARLRVDGLRKSAQLQEAVALVQEMIKLFPGPGLHAELGRLMLLSGDLMGAVEACMAEEEAGTEQARVLEDALRAFTPDVVYGGGWGTGPPSAITLEGALSASLKVSAAHRFLEFLLGNRGAEWTLESACLIVHQGRYYDAMAVAFPSGDRATLFFVVDSASPGESTESRTLGCFVPGDGLRFAKEMGDVDVTFVFEHLMLHSSQTLATN